MDRRYIAIFCACDTNERMTQTNCIVWKHGAFVIANLSYISSVDEEIQQTIKCYNIITIVMALRHNRHRTFNLMPSLQVCLSFDARILHTTRKKGETHSPCVHKFFGQTKASAHTRTTTTGHFTQATNFQPRKRGRERAGALCLCIYKGLESMFIMKQQQQQSTPEWHSVRSIWVVLRIITKMMMLMMRRRKKLHACSSKRNVSVLNGNSNDVVVIIPYTAIWPR